jgi:hypothetical protein
VLHADLLERCVSFPGSGDHPRPLRCVNRVSLLGIKGTYTSRRTLDISAKRNGRSLNTGCVVSLASRSCRNSAKSSCEVHLCYHVIHADEPTLSQSGGTMWHFFFNLRLTAIQSGTRDLIGGLSGPYAPLRVGQAHSIRGMDTHGDEGGLFHRN